MSNEIAVTTTETLITGKPMTRDEKARRLLRFLSPEAIARLREIVELSGQATHDASYTGLDCLLDAVGLLEQPVARFGGRVWRVGVTNLGLHVIRMHDAPIA